MERRTVFELAAGHFVAKHEDALFLGPPGTGKSHLAQAIGRAVIQQGHRVLYREAHVLLEELAEATIDGTRKAQISELATVPLLIRPLHHAHVLKCGPRSWRTRSTDLSPQAATG